MFRVIERLSAQEQFFMGIGHRDQIVPPLATIALIKAFVTSLPLHNTSSSLSGGTCRNTTGLSPSPSQPFLQKCDKDE